MKFKSGGGGFLNGMSGTILSYKWGTKEWPAKTKGKEGYSTLSLELNILPDGATTPVQQFLPAGFFYPDNQSVDEDGATLSSDRDGSIIAGDSEAAKFVQSVVDAENGLPEGDGDGQIPEDGHRLTALNNLRVTFKKIVDKEATQKFGKRKDKKDPKKSYDRDYLTVTAVLGYADAKATKAPKAAAPKSAGKSTKTAPVVANTEQADSVILSLVADAKGNTVERGKVSSLIVKYSLKANLSSEVRDALRAQLADVAYLTDAAERGIVSFDAATNVIGLPE